MGAARTLYERFRGGVARKTLRVGIRFANRWLTKPARAALDIPAEIAIIGHVSAIEYDAKYDGKTVKARHVFAPGARPLLAVGTGHGQAFLLGNRYRFTDRGFVDFDAQGAIDYDEHSGKIKRLRLDKGE